MRNSSNDMYTNGEYFKNNPTWAVADAPWKADVINGLIMKNNLRPASVVDVGCGAGRVLEQLAKRNESFQSVTGFDISPQAISLANSYNDRNIVFRNEDFLKITSDPADLLLLIDVLEHVDDFYQFLRALKSRSRYFIFHIPLDLCCRTILKPHVLLQQRQAVGHIHYFSREMVFWFLKDTGYEFVDWVYTKPVVDWLPPDSFRRRVKKLLRNLSYRAGNNLSAKLWGGYSLMILAK